MGEEEDMPRTVRLNLNAAQKAELEEARDHHQQPHMREKAAALLKIAGGENGLQVAQHGLLKRRDSDTVYRWVERYRREGISGLKVRKGRGRKPAFSPSLPDCTAGEGGAVGGPAQRP